ncbi:hypothetical protein DL96DRAFT_569710 [Flagelloscypha sp. PMI_526]|nr:hypothetical protein DL96DRAFT_569710 [Flagelloscypha sp. PMI_526]
MNSEKTVAQTCWEWASKREVGSMTGGLPGAELVTHETYPVLQPNGSHFYAAHSDLDWHKICFTPEAFQAEPPPQRFLPDALLPDWGPIITGSEPHPPYRCPCCTWRTAQGNYHPETEFALHLATAHRVRVPYDSVLYSLVWYFKEKIHMYQSCHLALEWIYHWACNEVLLELFDVDWDDGLFRGMVDAIAKRQDAVNQEMFYLKGFTTIRHE